MSFDLVVQRFGQGDGAAMPTDAFEAVFGPYVDRAETQLGFWHVRLPDGGEADLYADLDGPALDGLMISHFSPGMVLDLLVEFATRAEAVVLVPGCPTLLIDEAQRVQLPDELRTEAVLVSSGADVEAALGAC